MIEFDQRDRKSLPKKRRYLADCADFALAVEQRKIRLGRRVEFENLRNVEAALKFLPDVGAEAIAARESQLVLRLRRMRRGFDEISAQLADVLEDRASRFDDVFP